MASGPSKEVGSDLIWSALAPENRRRLAEVLRVQIPEVFRANRVIEQTTGYTSEIGKNMMVDVLAHLGTLAQHCGQLTPEQQASQITKIEEHLRRAIIEHPEEVIRNRIGDVEDRWLTYHREVFPMRERGVTLQGAPLHRELEEGRARIRLLLESARAKKPEETTWEESLTAAAEMTEAAAVTLRLADQLEQSIGAADAYRREEEREEEQRRREEDRRAEDRRRDEDRQAEERRSDDERKAQATADRRRTTWQWAIALLVAIVAALASYIVGSSNASEEPAKSTGTPTATATRTP